MNTKGIKITVISTQRLATLIYILVLTLLLNNYSYGQTTDNTPVMKNDIIGLWMRDVPSGIGGINGKEGLFFKSDGTYEFIGIASMNALIWKVDGDMLISTTNTDRYPKPEETKLQITLLSEYKLTLVGKDYISGSYTREDPKTSQALVQWHKVINGILIDNAKSYVVYVNENLDKYKKEELTLDPEKKGQESRRLILLTDNGQPIKLSLTEPDDLGKMEWGSTYYYLNGDIFFFKAPYSGHIFKNGRQVLWVNENMNPLTDIPEKDMKDAEIGIQERSRKYLSLFNTAPPLRN